MRDDGLQLLGDAARVSQISDDEAGHAGQQRDGFGDVAGGWDIEVEQDRQVVVLTQFLAYGVENRFALWRKTPQDQHRFPRDRVDNLTDLLVVEQKVDELRNLDV